MLPRHDVGKDIRSGLYYYLVGTSPPPPDKTRHVLHVRLGGSKHAGRYIESQLHRKRARIVSWSRSPFAPTHGFKRARIQRRRRLFMGPLPFQHSSLGGCVATEGGGEDLTESIALQRVRDVPVHLTPSSHCIPRPTCLPCRWTPSSGAATNRNRNRDDDNGENNRPVGHKLAVRRVQGQVFKHLNSPTHSVSQPVETSKSGSNDNANDNDNAKTLDPKISIH